MPKPKLDLYNFLYAWMWASFLTILPISCLLLPLVFFREMLIALAVGVIFLGIPISAFLEYKEIQERLTFIIAGTISGQIFLPIILYALSETNAPDLLQANSITFQSAVDLSLILGGVHGALAAYIYYKIAHQKLP